MAGSETDALLVDRPESLPATNGADAPKPRSPWWYSWRRLKRNRRALVGLCIVVLLVFLALFADLLAPMDPNRQILEYVEKPSGFKGNVLLARSESSSYGSEMIPIERYRIDGDSVRYVDVLGRDNVIARSALAGADESEWHQEPVYLLGADKFGRDVLSRLIEGGQISLLVGFSAEIIALLIGVTLGALAGYYRGWVDAVVMYMANVIWSFPFILLVIAFSLALGHGLWQSFVAIGVASWVDVCRIVRGQFFSLRETEYVEATRALGFGSVRTIFRHMLPNAIGPITVIATAGFASAIIAEASLSYLGLGVQPPQASWGQMIRDGQGYISAGKNWGLAIYPSIAIALAVFGFNMLGDGLRDAFDPKMRT
ncbi:MAG TPA: ABC transporter permease [Candidatus Kapabacteria bacterium]|jgi:oligopeptide transport system permease protein|nr:ABC transporter permease [Candidatus Kapabacteria bacterium]